MTTASSDPWTRWRTLRDVAAFRAVVAPELRHLVTYARRLGCSWHDAEDAVQDALARVAADPSRASDDTGPRVTLFRAVRAAAASARRSASRRTRRERAAARTAITRPTLALDAHDEVAHLLEGLDPAGRELLVLRYVHDLEYREIAAVLGISEGACRVRAHRAVERLRARAGSHATTALAAAPLAVVAEPTRLLPLATAGSSASVAVTGGVAMSVLSKSAVTGVALAALAGAWWLGATVSSSAPGDGTDTARDERAALRREVDRRDAALVRAERTEERLRKEIATLAAGLHGAAAGEREDTGELADTPPRRLHSTAADTADAIEGLPRPTTADDRSYDLARALADELDVSREALDATIAAYQALSGADRRADASERLAAVAARRGETFRALVALARGGLSHTCLPEIAAHAWRAGEEQHAITASQRTDVAGYGHWALLRMLSVADTAPVREHLLDVLRTTTDDGRAMSAAESLGDLHEPRGIPLAAPLLRRRTWGERLRATIAFAMTGMDAEAAAEAFEAHLRSPDTDLLPHVVRELARVAPDRARTELETTLVGARLDDLDATQRADLERVRKSLQR